MRRLFCLAVAALWSVAVASAAFVYPEHVDELWRSLYGRDGGLMMHYTFAPSPSDRSFWVIDGATLVHYANDGTLLSRSQPLHSPCMLAVDAANGSCWVLQGGRDELVHLSAEATLLSTTPGPASATLARLLPSPADGSVWISDTDQIMHVDAAGAIVWALATEGRVLAVDPGDGSAWLLEGSEIVRRAPNGHEFWRASDLAVVTPFAVLVCLSEDPRDQSVWVGNENGLLVHLSATGRVLWQASNGGTQPVRAIEVLPSDGSLWVQYGCNDPDSGKGCYLARLDASGTELLRYDDSALWFTNLRDGSTWINRFHSTSAYLTLYSADGDVVATMEPNPLLCGFDPVDSGYWTRADYDEPAQLSRYQADGTLLWTQPRPTLMYSLFWVDPTDGSCWIEDRQTPGGYGVLSALIRVSPEGEELGRMSLPLGSGGISHVWPLCFSPTDHTWWARDMPDLVHFAEDGTELRRYDYVGAAQHFAVSPLDGSLWTVSESYVRHLAADGTVLGEAGFDEQFFAFALAADGGIWTVAATRVYDQYGGHWATKFLRLSSTGTVVAEVPLPAGLPNTGTFELKTEGASLQVNPSDGSLYAVAQRMDPYLPRTEVIFRMAADGTLLWQVPDFCDAFIAMVPQDGSLWVADQGEDPDQVGAGPSARSQVAHLSADGQYLWRGDTFDAPRQLQVNSFDGTAWLSDYWNWQLVHLRGMLPPFPDIAVDSWAFDAIAACAQAGIVQGYWDGYRPDQVVTRDQMAVYVSRALAGGDEGVQVPSGVAEPTFADVDAEHWAYRHIEYCVGGNVVQGYHDGGYHPDEVVNRGQMAVYIARALVTPSGDAALPDPPEAPTFPDVTAGNEWAWCYPHVEYCAAEGIVRGYWDGYRPAAPVTRDQMAVYIARAFALPL